MKAACFAFFRLLPSGDLPGDALPKAYSPWKQFKDGFSYVQGHQVILAVVLITMVLNLCCFPYMTLLPIFVRDVLFYGAKELGIIGMATGIGAVTGTLTLAALGDVRRKNILWLWLILIFVTALGLFSVSYTHLTLPTNREV